MTRTHVAAAVLACGALMAAITGRLLACAGCDYAVLGVPLFAAGSVYFLALGVLALLGVSPAVLGWVSLPGVAVHAGLVRFLLSLGAPCVTCLIAAALLFALSVVALAPHRVYRFAPAMAAILGVAILPLWSRFLIETERVPGLPEFAHRADLRSPPDAATLMVVYEREACPYCRSFHREYEPRLIREFGAGLVIRRVDAGDRRGLRRLPTFLIRAPDGSMRVVKGLPRYDDLAAQLR